MARMIPAMPAEHIESAAEKELFVRMANELSDEWIVLHSLGLAIHDRKPWAEIDFVLIGPPGVFCLEVKGGLVSREEGVWYTTPLHGRESGVKKRLSESPFEQVGSASAALYRHLEKRLPDFARSIVGYGVAVPDCEWTITGPDIDRSLVYDHNDTTNPLQDFVDRMTSTWAQRLGRQWHREREILRRSTKQRVLDELRGDFALVPSLRAMAEAAGRELIRLTEQQADLFARLSENARVIARGGAGTGKTTIALAEARRCAANGSRVLLVCFSRNLAAHLGSELEDVNGIVVTTLHSLMAQTVAAAGLENRLPDAEDPYLYETFFPELCLEVLLEESRPRFDVLIVDEGQDLLLEPYMDVFDVLIEGGIAAGKWRWFIDPNQNLFTGISAAGMRRLLMVNPVDWPLTINCRNTAPIATQVSLLAGVRADLTLIPDGPSVEYQWWDSVDEQRRLISNHISRVRHAGFGEGRLIILSPYHIERSSLANGLIGSSLPIVDVSRGGIDDPTPGVRFSTIASFKGLESDIVLLIDVDDLDDPRSQFLVYVGASRARILLSVSVAARLQTRIEQLAREYGQRIAPLQAT
jgi:hypothetical protein